MNMRKTWSLFLFLFMVFPAAWSAAGVEKICFQDDNDNRYLLSGGKPGKKAYFARVTLGVCGNLGGLATLASWPDGYHLTIIFGPDVNQNCIPSEIDVIMDSTLTTGSGTYYDFPRADPPEGDITLTQVICVPDT